MKIICQIVFVIAIILNACTPIENATENIHNDTTQKTIKIITENTKQIKNISYYLENKINPKFFTLANFSGTLTFNGMFEGEASIGIQLKNNTHFSIWLSTNYTDSPEFLLPDSEIKFDTIFAPGIMELEGTEVEGQCYYSRGYFDPLNGDTPYVAEIWRLKNIKCISLSPRYLELIKNK